MSKPLWKILKDRLLWKEVYQYEHSNREETVTLFRHRITGATKRIWYEGYWGWKE